MKNVLHKIDSNLRLMPKIVIGFSVMALLVAVLFSFAINLHMRRELRENMRSHLADVVGIMALQVDADLLFQLGDSPNPEQAAGYEQVLQEMRLMQAQATDVNSIYTMRRSDAGEIIFLVCTDDEGYEDLGWGYENPSELLSAQFNTLDHTLVESKIYTDEYGAWLSGYAPLYDSDGRRVAVMGVDIAADTLLAQQRRLLIVSLLTFLVAVPLAVGLGSLMAVGISRPINRLSRIAHSVVDQDMAALAAAMTAVSHGDLNQSVQILSDPVTVDSENEIGELSQAFNRIIASLKESGTAFDTMTGYLQQLLAQLAESSKALNAAAESLSISTQFSGKTCGNISSAIHEVLHEGKQAPGENSTISASGFTEDQTMARLSLVIGDIHQGAQEQAKWLAEVNRMDEHLARENREVSASAAEVSAQMRLSSQTVKESIDFTAQTRTAMEKVNTAMDELAHRIRGLGDRSTHIGEVIETIDDTANQTKLLALNAQIESARSNMEVRKLVENILDHQLFLQAHLLAELLNSGRAGENQAYWDALAKRLGCDNICVTDETGVVIISDDHDMLGWQFPDDPDAQTYPFLALLENKSGFVHQDMQQRSIDGKLYKYVGIPRQDQKGIVQVGYEAESRIASHLQVSAGFAVVANEVSQLAERSGTAAKEVAGVIRDMQQRTAETVAAMGEAGENVSLANSWVQRTEDAIQEIAENTLSASMRADEIDQAIQSFTEQFTSMEQLISETSSVAGQHQAATEELQALSTVVADNLRNVLHAADEMSERTVEFTATAETLLQMARTMDDTVRQFTNSGSEEQEIDLHMES